MIIPRIFIILPISKIMSLLYFHLHRRKETQIELDNGKESFIKKIITLNLKCLKIVQSFLHPVYH